MHTQKIQSRQFIIGTHKFSELVSGQNGPAHGSEPPSFPLRSAKSRTLRELWHEKCTRAPWTFPFKLAKTSYLQPGQTGLLNSDLSNPNVVFSGHV